MTTAEGMMPGLARIRARFLDMLDQREQRLSQAIRIARATSSRGERIAALTECQEILHKLAGTAGSVGLPEIGKKARRCEEAIFEHLDGDDCSSETVHGLLDWFMDTLASMPERQCHGRAQYEH
ncbi:Hpt domain-containing protein [Roseovarius sp. 2305UL8-3]|uniref:Hpt domain-containing protein n=1 Tax=Roseovarius conchicola TaxID=3121636 RepID=UPI003527073D